MSTVRRTARRWILRLVGLGLVAFVLTTQVDWQDSLHLTDGEVLEGRVEARPDGGWTVASDAGPAARYVAGAEVAVREGPAGAIPEVTWGIRTLGRRLSSRPGYALAVLFLLFLTWVITGVRWHGLLRAVDVPLKLGETVRLNLIGAFFNVAVPGSTGGDVVKAWYAARATKRGVRAVLSVFTDRLVGLVGLGLLAALALAFAPSDAGYGPAKLIVAVALAALGGGAAILLSARLRRWLGVERLFRKLPFQGVVAEATAALKLYRDRPVTLATALAISLLNHAIAGTSVWLLAQGLEIQGLTLPTALALVPVANLFGAIPLLPGGWGVGEIAFAYLFGQVGIPATEAVSLSVVFRLSMLATSLLGGLLWLFWKDRPTRDVMAKRVEAAEALV